MVKRLAAVVLGIAAVGTALPTLASAQTLTLDAKLGGLVPDPVRSLLYAAQASNSSILVISPLTESVEREIWVGEGPADVDLSVDAGRLYATLPETKQVAVVDLALGSVGHWSVEARPERVIAGPDGLVLVATVNGGGGVRLLDPDGETLAVVHTGLSAPALTRTADGRTVYVLTADPLGQKVIRYDLSNGYLRQEGMARLAAGTGANDIQATPDGRKLYVLGGAEPVLAFSGDLEPLPMLSLNGDMLAATNDDGPIYVVSGHSVGIFDGYTRDWGGGLLLPRPVQLGSLRLSPDGSQLYMVLDEGPAGSTLVFADTEQLLPSPELGEPADEGTVKALAPTLTWDEVDFSGSYRVEIGRSPYRDSFGEFTRPILVEDLTQTTWTPPALTSGKYYWHVAADDGVNFTWSEVRSFVIETEPEWIRPIDTEQLVGPGETLYWSGVKGAKSYWVEIGRSPRVDELGDYEESQAVEWLVAKYNKAQIPKSLPSGVYYWHVQGIDASDNYGSYSVSGKFRLDATPPEVSIGPDLQVVVGSAVTFKVEASDSSGTQPSSYRWRFSDGAWVSGMEVDHTFREVGLHTVEVTVRDNVGNEGFDRATIFSATKGQIRSAARWRSPVRTTNYERVRKPGAKDKVAAQSSEPVLVSGSLGALPR